MSQTTQPLTENSIIDWSVSLVNYRTFLTQTMGLQLKPEHDFYFWLNAQTGKTLKEAIGTYGKEPEQKNMDERLSEKRFNFISDVDKAFILAFDNEIGVLGYGYGNMIGKSDNGKFMIVYSKLGVKSPKVIARIFIYENEIILKFILSEVKKHSSYVENTPEHIKDVFIGKEGDCMGCNPKGKCRMVKHYAIDGKPSVKCSERIFLFRQPSVEKLSDYIDLLSEFHQRKSKLTL
ncbi:MAG: DUF6434 domain-containing protein [Defluviitaleaceae bacterium]|nr:DUF6434 domain-containing protein [Defluviitaleaceae bacterium]